MKFRERMAEKLKLPKDLVMGAAVLTVTGHSEAYIENYRGIIEYTEQRIRLQTKTCQMTLCGEQLHIDYYTEDEMKEIGKIPMTFIRAPYIDDVYGETEILAVVDGKVVAARQGSQLATAFHPELNDDTSVHAYFVEMIKGSKAQAV